MILPNLARTKEIESEEESCVDNIVGLRSIATASLGEPCLFMVHLVSPVFLMHHFVAIKSANFNSIPLQTNECETFTILASSLQNLSNIYFYWQACLAESRTLGGRNEKTNSSGCWSRFSIEHIDCHISICRSILQHRVGI